MSALNFNRDATPMTAHTLTETADGHTLIVKSEHSDALPSVIGLRRKLPGTNGTVRRVYVDRKIGVTLDAGTDNERNALINAKLELSIPVGASDADVVTAIEDIVGISDTTEFQDLRQFGILS